MKAEGVQSADTGEPLAICRFSCSFHLHLIAQSQRKSTRFGAANGPRALRHGLIILAS